MKDFFGQSILGKVVLLLLLTLVLALPLAQIGGLIHQRGESRDKAAQGLAAEHAGPQVLIGPVLVVPYVERWTEVVKDKEKGVTSEVRRSEDRVQLFFPERLDVDGILEPEKRYRGIFTILFYKLTGSLSGRFAPVDVTPLPHSQKNSTLEAGTPFIALSLSDVRGLQGGPELRIGGETAAFVAGRPRTGKNSWLADGIQAPLPPTALHSWRQGQPLAFDLKLSFVGQTKLSIVPLGGETTAHFTSSWPHPSFGGSFLARDRKVDAQGFEARWAVSSLVSSARSQLLLGHVTGANRHLAEQTLETFDVSLVEPQNVHSLSDRAIKYGLLFVGLVLMAAFMFELFAKLRLHPVQYGLVGLSIALFFLLLLALSEKVAFGAAYASAATASVILLTVYFSAVLRSYKSGFGLGAYVAVLYAALYGLLSSEDNALLLGSLLIFCLLALLMVATRKVDWYALSTPAPEPAPSA
jgi:inner membrane protein